VERVKVSQHVVTLRKGQKIRLAATAPTQEGTLAKPAWTSVHTRVATVSQKGLVTAKRVGTATIRVSAGAKSATVKVRVVAAKAANPKVRAVRVTGNPRTMSAGQTAYITGVVTPNRAVKALVTYRSGKPGVVSVDKSGRLIAKAPGKAVITVRASGAKATFTITVKEH
jgi:uncharacterized protein YjdB